MIGELCIEKKLITAKQLNKAIKHQTKYGGLLGMRLVSLGFITTNQLQDILNQQIFNKEDNK